MSVVPFTEVTAEELLAELVIPDGKAVVWTTPTGHSYRADPPPLLPRDSPDHLRQ